MATDAVSYTNHGSNTNEKCEFVCFSRFRTFNTAGQGAKTKINPD